MAYVVTAYIAMAYVHMAYMAYINVTYDDAGACARVRARTSLLACVCCIRPHTHARRAGYLSLLIVSVPAVMSKKKKKSVLSAAQSGPGPWMIPPSL